MFQTNNSPSKHLLVQCQKQLTLKNSRKLKKNKGKKWTAKRMHGLFARDMEDKDKNSTWRWMKKSDLKRCAEALICSA